MQGVVAHLESQETTCSLQPTSYLTFKWCLDTVHYTCVYVYTVFTVHAYRRFSNGATQKDVLYNGTTHSDLP